MTETAWRQRLLCHSTPSHKPVTRVSICDCLIFCLYTFAIVQPTTFPLFSVIGFVAGIVGWVVNVGSNFAHVTVSFVLIVLYSTERSSSHKRSSQPCFKYPSVAYIDKFCDPIELVKDIVFFYVMQTIKQSLKVVFSMQFLGDPTLLALQLRTGLSDLVIRTSKCRTCLALSKDLLYFISYLQLSLFVGDEVRAGGSNGFGRGVSQTVLLPSFTFIHHTRLISSYCNYLRRLLLSARTPLEVR